jgi:hypothetical protein
MARQIGDVSHSHAGRRKSPDVVTACANHILLTETACVLPVRGGQGIVWGLARAQLDSFTPTCFVSFIVFSGPIITVRPSNAYITKRVYGLYVNPYGQCLNALVKSHRRETICIFISRLLKWAAGDDHQKNSRKMPLTLKA